MIRDDHNIAMVMVIVIITTMFLVYNKEQTSPIRLFALRCKTKVLFSAPSAERTNGNPTSNTLGIPKRNFPMMLGGPTFVSPIAASWKQLDIALARDKLSGVDRLAGLTSANVYAANQITPEQKHDNCINSVCIFGGVGLEKLWNKHNQIPAQSRFSSVRLAAVPQTPIVAPELAGDVLEAPLIPPPPSNASQKGIQKTNPSFHLLIPASESNPDLCKTLLSSFMLSYPSATLVNYGKKFDGDGWDKGTHAGKIRGVFDFLNDKKKVKDDDLVLIIDGYDTWFQLPPEVMIRRYHKMTVEADKHLRQRYGEMTEGIQGDGTPDRVQKYTQKVIFGADKICWPNPAEDPACAAIPYSSLPENIYGPDTDKDPTAMHNRPRYLNSGNVIGPAKDVRAIYGYAVKKVEEQGRGSIGDQFVFAEIFGEQEYQRETIRANSHGTMGQWYDWLSNKMGLSPSPLSANITINNMTVIPGQRYEYSIGLDYTSQLFQTMTHSAADIDFITYNSSTTLTEIQSSHPSLSGIPFSLPPDLQTAPPPFTYVSPGYNHTLDADTSNSHTLLLPYSPALDSLPGTPPSSAPEPNWSDIPLATNIHTSTLPTTLHINGDKSLLRTWWPRLWYHPHARALLRRYVRSTQTHAAYHAAAAGGQSWWDRRGGRGGVWTDGGNWMGWGEVCKGVEGEVFGDGKGEWGKEEGERRWVNSFGKVIIGEEEGE
ncbi:hypothetical protein ACLMJK_007581 [Lecanora helva]